MTSIKFTSENKAVVTKMFMKKAMIFGTDEYRLLKEFKKENPNVEVTTKNIKKNPNKQSYKNLTYTNMRKYISTLENPEVELNAFETQIKRSSICKSPYKTVMNWFINRYRNTDEMFDAFFLDKAEKNLTQALA